MKEGSSDKEYHVQILEGDGGCVVNYQNGRRGGTLASGTKTETPVTKAEAEKIFDKTVKEKTRKGYTQSETGKTYSDSVYEERKSDILPQLSNSMEEDQALKCLKDPTKVAQKKYDGERRLVESNKEVSGINRKGLIVQLPKEIIESLPKKPCTIDNEIIGDKLYCFDLLSYDGKDLRSLPLIERLKILKTIKFGKNIEMVETAFTTEEKTALYESLKEQGAEGIIFKTKDAPYNVGRPASGGNSLKFKFYKTATFIVGSLTKAKRSVGLLVVDGKKTVEVGKVTIPPNFEVPEVESLVEVRYLYAYKGGAVYQPVYLGKRTDLEKTDACITQLEYKEEA